MVKSSTPKTPEQLRDERKASLPDALTEQQLSRVSTGRVRYALSQLAQNNVDQVQRWLTAVEASDGPKAAMELFLKMIEYSVPKLSRTEVKVEDAAGNTAMAQVTMDDLKELIRQGVDLQRNVVATQAPGTSQPENEDEK